MYKYKIIKIYLSIYINRSSVQGLPGMPFRKHLIFTYCPEEGLGDGYRFVITSADPPVAVALVLFIKKSLSESVIVLNFNTAADKLQIQKERVCEGIRRICMSYVATVTTSWFLSKISKGSYLPVTYQLLTSMHLTRTAILVKILFIFTHQSKT